MEEILMNEYRCLNDGEKTKWKQLTSIGEFIWDGVYAIRLVADEPSLGLPFKVNGEEVINLLVNDQFRDNHIQNNRIIVQTLTRVDRATGEVLTYTRTRRYNNGEHKWGEWVNNDNGSNSGGVVTGSSIAVDKNINIESTNPVQNKAIAKALEDAVARGRELAKRDLYIAAGALYNDTDEVIKRTAFWGEEVEHLPKHYYLNGIGDIGEEEMMKIYECKDAMNHILLCPTSVSRYFQDVRLPRTLIPHIDYRFSFGKNFSSSYVFSSGIEVIKWCVGSQFASPLSGTASISDSLFFYKCSSLRVIDTFITGKNLEIHNAVNLKEVRISLKHSISLPDSSNLSKDSVLYMIGNCTATSAITIALNTGLYDSLSIDDEILTSLAAKPLVTLVTV